ncbi:MAG: VTT domain-containing protein [Betaproteobacteria bacterium]|nr:VTT domain-containing protein [Betaproteobacteria bacterium]MDH3437804.1 VTT domain-containing protein [Betaproteobacteria bacterium]
MEEVTGLLAQHGLALVFANVMLAQLGVPLPAVPLLVLAGAFVAQGNLALAPLLMVTTVASLLGDTLWYLAGRRHGYSILRTLCRIAIEPDSCVKQTENVFLRWGSAALVVAKYIPGFATVAPPLAGTMKIPFPRFVFLSAVGALLWAVAPIAAGAWFHDEIDWALQQLEQMGAGAIALILAVLTIYIGIKAGQRYLLIRFLRSVRISVEELREILQREKQPVILDARSALARKLDPRVVPGAIAVDIDDPGGALPALPEDREIIVYCT